MKGRFRTGNKLKSSLIVVIFFHIFVPYAVFASSKIETSLFDFDIQRLSADSAINAISQQSNTPAIFPYDKVKLFKTNKLKGTYNLSDALDLLFFNTGLKAYLTPYRVIVVITQEEYLANEGNNMNLKNVKKGVFGGLAILATNAISVVSAEEDLGADVESEKLEQKIVITGSHIRRETYGGPVPVNILDRKTIISSGSQDMIDVANNLTINSGSRFTNESVRLSGTSQFNIRGLGPGSTLTLINGRRAGIAPVTTNLGNQFFDIKQLPLAMIKQIEFQTDGAAATYGSQAVAGVANIITRKGFEGFELSARYQDSSNTAYDVNLVGGVKNLKSSFNIYATLSDQSINFRTDFDFINRRVNGDGDPLASRFLSSTGSPGTYQLATIDPITSEINRTGTEFADPNCEAAGGFLIGTRCRHNFADQLAIIPDERRASVFTEFDYDFSDDIKFYSELSFSRNKVGAILGSPFYSNGLVSGGNTFIPASHPFNFFVQNTAGDGLEYINPQDWDPNIHTAVDLVCRCRPFGIETNGDSPSGIDNSIDIDLSYYRAVGGIDWNIDNNWQLVSSYVYSLGIRLESTHLGLSSTTFNDAVLNGQFNPFGSSIATPDLVSPRDGVSVARNDEAVLNQIIHTLNDRTESEQAVFESVLSGSLFELDSRDVGIAVGTQLRSESYTFEPDSLSAKGLAFGSTPTASISGETDVLAFFTEALVPLSEDIEVQLALRYEDYDTVGSTTDPKVAVLWQVTDDFSLRSSYGTTFQAPSNIQTGETLGAEFLTDPVVFNNGVATCQNGSASNLTTVRTFGDDSLEPTSAVNFNFGLIYETDNNLQIKADLWSIEYDNLIAQDSSASGVVNSECSGVPDGGTPNFDPRVIRSSEGQLREVNLNFVNLGEVNTNGFDLSFAYDWEFSDWGKVNLGLTTTYVNKFDIISTPDAEVIHGAGSFNSSNAFKSIPQIRSVLTSTWLFGENSLNANIRYIDSYDNDLTADEGDKISSQVTVDVQYTFTLINGNDGETTFSIGARNLFDQAPPSLGEGIRPGYDSTTHDVRGRVAYVSVKHRF